MSPQQLMAEAVLVEAQTAVEIWDRDRNAM
jgi:hypothetical protein